MGVAPALTRKGSKGLQHRLVCVFSQNVKTRIVNYAPWEHL